MDPRELLLHIDACQPDACPPGGGELQDAEMASLAAVLSRDAAAVGLMHRVRAADAKIAAALRRPAHAVPEGLEARLLAAVRERAAADALAAPAVAAARTAVRAGTSAAGGVAPAAPQVAPLARFSWRRALVGTSLVAAVAVLAAYVMNLPRPITADEVVEEVRQVYDEQIAQTNDWILETKIRPSADFGIPAFALINAESHQSNSPWREFKIWNNNAVAYDLYGNPTPAERAEMDRRIDAGLFPNRAVLIVIDRSVYGLPTSPPDIPQGQSAGPVIGVWRSEDMIYALAVEGRANAPVEEKIQLYRGLVRQGELARSFVEQLANKAY